MSRQRVDPFDVTPEATPPKGTGLSAGTAGERRAGNQRTESERVDRHKEVMDDSSENGVFIKTVTDGRIRFTRRGYENVEIPPPMSKMVSESKKLSLSEQWAEHRKRK